MLIIIIVNIFILLFFSNFPLAKIFLGDNGAYYIGCLIGLLTFKYLDLIFSLYPLLINIVIYPLMEVSFSLFRKLFEKKSPFLPDNLHLHMLVFNFNKRFINNLNKCNYISSAYIIIFLLLFYTFIYLFIDNPFVQHILSLLFIILYIAFYYVLRRNIQV